MSRVLGAAQALVGLMIVLTPYVMFPVCTEQMDLKMGGVVPMKCHWAAQAELGLGALILLGGLALVIAKRTEAKRLLSVITAGMAVSVISVPTWLIGMCGSASQPCRVGTLPALLTLGGASLIVSGLTFITAKEAIQEAHEPLGAPLPS